LTTILGDDLQCRSGYIFWIGTDKLALAFTSCSAIGEVVARIFFRDLGETRFGPIPVA
jgi:hypothetical protein